MIVLSLPPRDPANKDWKDFKYALKQYGFSIVKIQEETSDYVVVNINTSSESDNEIVAQLMKLCFGDYYCV